MERTSVKSESQEEREQLLQQQKSTTSSVLSHNHNNNNILTEIEGSSATSLKVQMNQLLNNMSQRITSSSSYNGNNNNTNGNNNNKPKYGNPMMNFQQKLRNNVSPIRWLLIFAGIFIISYVCFYYIELSPRTIPYLEPDRASSYNVKVLPALLSDEELAKLPKDAFSYLTMIDAGSSGCRAHIYRYGKLGSLDGPLYVLPQHQSKKIKPGLSSFASSPTEAGKSLQGLIEFMKENVPESDWSVTPIWLKATAGLRMLPTSTSEEILESVRSFLLSAKNSPFLFRYSWARIIPGNEEGGFGWIAFNYLKKIIGPKKPKKTTPQAQDGLTSTPSPYAVIEMGGASAQVSQLAPSMEEANKIPSEYRFSFTIEGEEYHLYTHSYLGYGAEQAKEQFNRLLKKNSESIKKDPCKHEGIATSRRQLVSSHYQQRRILQNNASSTNTAAHQQKPGVIALPLGDTTLATAVSATAGSATSPTCVRSVASLFSTITGLLSPFTSATTTTTTTTTTVVERSSCATSGPHSFGCVYQPDFVVKSANILAFENFYYMSSALGVKPISSRSLLNNNHSPAFSSNSSSGSGSSVMTTVATTFPLETTPNHIKDASELFCPLSWNEVQANYPKDAQPKDVNNKMCFLSAFAYSFLVDGLKIPNNRIITVQKEVGESEIEWALGAAYKEAADFLKRTHLRPT